MAGDTNGNTSRSELICHAYIRGGVGERGVVSVLHHTLSQSSLDMIVIIHK